MNFVDAILTALSMSIDACTENVVNGLEEKNMKIRKMLLISFVFGLFQFLMPVIGYFVGYSFKSYVEPYIPWIAFSLLLGLSIKAFIDWIKEFKSKEEICDKKITFLNILIQGVATSIDALCIGFVFLGYSIQDALITFVIIGVTTFILSFIAILISKQIAGKIQKRAGLIAALVFLVLAIKILLEGIL